MKKLRYLFLCAAACGLFVFRAGAADDPKACLNEKASSLFKVDFEKQNYRSIRDNLLRSFVAGSSMDSVRARLAALSKSRDDCRLLPGETVLEKGQTGVTFQVVCLSGDLADFLSFGFLFDKNRLYEVDFSRVMMSRAEYTGEKGPR